MRGILFFLCLLLVFSVNAQVPDVLGDPNWSPIDELTDEFNDSIIDNYKWNWKPPWGSFHGGDHTLSITCLSDTAANRRIEDGKLILSTTKDSSECVRHSGALTFNHPYTTGAIFSRATAEYGYFEISMIIPNFTADSTTRGFGPNFWFWPLQPYSTSNPGDVTWSEIDVYEFDATNNKHTSNVHYKELIDTIGDSDEILAWNLRSLGEFAAYDINNMYFYSYHTFSCLWNPDSISFFYDGTFIQSSKPYSDQLLPMNILVDINSPARNFNVNEFHENAIFPYEYKIDYIRSYKRKMDCDSILNTCVFYFGGYDNSIKKKITIGGGGCDNAQPTGTKLSLYAIEDVLLKGGFSVPLGAELTIKTNVSCYD